MKRILILTAAFGDGHNAAARSIREAVEILDPAACVEVLDPLEAAYGRFNRLARSTYLGLVRYAPGLWKSLYRVIDATPALAAGSRWTRLCRFLEVLLGEMQPDCVISTYPIYGDVIDHLFREHAERPFRAITVVTDSVTVNAAWHRNSSDLFCVANEATADVLRAAGLPSQRIATTGFPVSPAIPRNPPDDPPCGLGPNPRRILYMVHPGARKVGRTLDEILDIPQTRLTVIVGRDPSLKGKLAGRLARYGNRVRLFGWTNVMPRLLAAHELVVTKAGGATVQEAIASGCPLIVNHAIPGQEEGNARLVHEAGYGCVVDRPDQTADAIESAFAAEARQWRTWRANLARDRRPDAALRIAQLALDETDPAQSDHRPVPLSCARRPDPCAIPRPSLPFPTNATQRARSLLCDLHVHTNYSDGRLTVAEVVDYYGAHGFDCICITDHVADPRRLIGKLARLSRLTLAPAQFEEYFEVIRREAERAWRRYGMLVLAGFEFNKDGYTRKTSAHLLGIDLKQPIRPDLDLVPTIAAIHAQGALAVASHPHIMKSEWGKNTLYLWENQETFAPLLDAWEIANRDNFFCPVATKRYPFVANSDFHKPRHIFSWKTVLHCPKDPDAIKECIRRNENVSITLYRRNHSSALAVRPLPTADCIPLPVAIPGETSPAPALERVACEM